LDAPLWRGKPCGLETSAESAGSASEWNQAVEHLVQAHGGARNLIISRTPTLEQVHFAHLDTHVALETASLDPPDGHATRNRCPPDGPKYAPEPAGPSPVTQGRGIRHLQLFPSSAHSALTGLPHTGERPGLIGGGGPAHDAIVQAELADWASVVRRRLREKTA
jgi:hypothetical protein